MPRSGSAAMSSDQEADGRARARGCRAEPEALLAATRAKIFATKSAATIFANSRRLDLESPARMNQRRVPAMRGPEEEHVGEHARPRPGRARGRDRPGAGSRRAGPRSRPTSPEADERRAASGRGRRCGRRGWRNRIVATPIAARSRAAPSSTQSMLKSSRRSMAIGESAACSGPCARSGSVGSTAGAGGGVMPGPIAARRSSAPGSRAATGAAASPPLPPCSTITARAIRGSSAGAKETNQPWGMDSRALVGLPGAHGPRPGPTPSCPRPRARRAARASPVPSADHADSSPSRTAAIVSGLKPRSSGARVGHGHARPPPSRGAAARACRRWPRPRPARSQLQRGHRTWPWPMATETVSPAYQRAFCVRIFHSGLGMRPGSLVGQVDARSARRAPSSWRSARCRSISSRTPTL